MSHSDEKQEAAPDASGDTLANAHLGARDPLQQYSQRLLDRH